MSRLNEYEKSRKKHFSFLKANNIEPFPYSFNKTHNSSDIFQKYNLSLKENEYSLEIANVAGRLLVIRNMGKIAFMDLYDQSGKIQIVCKEDIFEKKDWELINNLDQGDIVGITGTIFKTKRGELSIDATQITFLSKCFLPLPEKYHGLQDPEVRYRQRYLDMIINPEVKNVFITRAKIIKIIREILQEKGFVEVETPILQPLYGGAQARPFVTKSYVWKRKLYLSISPELYLKRLLVGGFEKVYTISKNFRNEGVDRTHNPEFTMLELYEAYKDYNSAMDLIEEIYETIAIKLYGTTKINYQGIELDFKRPWKKLTMKQALKELADIDVDKMSDVDIKKLLQEKLVKDKDIHMNQYQKTIGLETGNDISLEFNKGLAIEELFNIFCEPKLLQPTHIIDHPKETTPLCKLHRLDKSLIERDEPYANYTELANIYSELNDPFLQEKLMKEQKKQGRAKGETHPIDKDFILALKYGMPPAYGIGIGIDRLVMLFTNSQSIRDVILFPMLKEKEEK